MFLRLKFWDLGFRVQCVMFSVQCLGFVVSGLKFALRRGAVSWRKMRPRARSWAHVAISVAA